MTRLVGLVVALLSALILISPCAVLASTDPVATQLQNGITEITLERTRCYGTCPTYKVILGANETATYISKAFAKREGQYQGTIYRYTFDQLAGLLDLLDFYELEDSYSRLMTDHATVITSIVRDGERKTVSNYANYGPIALWRIEMAIDAVVFGIKWEKIPVS